MSGLVLCIIIIVVVIIIIIYEMFPVPGQSA